MTCPEDPHALVPATDPDTLPAAIEVSRVGPAAPGHSAREFPETPTV